ncbi:glycosyltransferase [Paracoccus albus]|uniref:glycosyltransferase n=1 Tax=Paracoccus albus TaxID=3017784 RepID=UPI0022F0C5A3|nr:glycosyltransferase [Paracoccus albus]WBU61982.1 glycosyltransferase [Paracoccus albus]
MMIGLALYQGAEHIAAQLESIAAQTHKDWRLVVSDDGSDDAGPQILRDFAASRPDGQVQLVEGPRKGATQNFLSMIGHAQRGEYLSFSDQDDVWRPDKLARAIAVLGSDRDLGLYSARTTICDVHLNPLSASRQFPGPFDFRNALIQAVTAGNTLLLPPKAVDLAQRAAPAAATADIEAHDWWLYQLVAGAGHRIFRDDAEVLLYRQHQDNLKGRNDTLPAMRARLGQLFAGDYGHWVHANTAALTAVQHELTSENRDLLQRFSSGLDMPGPRMALEMKKLGLRRQTAAGSAAFYAAVLAGKLRRPKL